MALNQRTDSGEIIATMRDVTMTFDGYLTRALARINLDVLRGEVLGIAGAKGAGKSTLLRILAGRLRPTEGAVKVFGRSPRRGSTKARIGYVPGKAEADKPAGFLRRLFSGRKEAPGGAGLTQAIMGGRDLVILDEPFADMGAAEKKELKTLIRELKERGKTVIVASETLVDTKDIADRLLIVHEGKTQAAGSLQELVNATNAIRFLGPVLPPEVGERIAKILQREITADSSLTPIHSKPGASKAEQKTVEVPTPDEHLARLAQGSESSSIAEPKPREENSIDHDKLEGLTKPTAPE
jgi:ABC-type multidrug transport system ATPase subunit